MIRRLCLGLLCGALSLPTLTGCGGRQELLTQDINAVKKGDAQPLVDEAMGHWAKRGDKAELQKSIDAFKKAADMDPTRADVQVMLARAYYSMSNLHLRWEDDSKDAQKASFDKGVIAAETAIKLTSPEFAAKIKAGESWNDAIPSVTSPKGLEAMYWYSSNLGKWMVMEGIATALKYKDRVSALMTHCKKLDEKFFYGGPHRYFGAYWAKVPFSSDLNKSKMHFEKSIELAPEYLETKVYMAREWATRVDEDEGGGIEVFKKLLKEVVDADANALSADLVPENQNAQRQAKGMIEDAEDFF
ncbi:MAG: TRAP transporter TatT component family protein [Bradymonadia bacterium]